MVIAGAGKLGRALLDFEGFAAYGLRIAAAFDVREDMSDERVMPMDSFRDYCRTFNIHAGIITVPAAKAQEVCDIMTESGITAIWNFAPTVLKVPENVTVCQEDLALSLAHLTMKHR